MGIQINGQTDTISAVDGALTVSGAELPTVTNLNATGIVTATGFVGNITGNINATGVSTIATLNVTQSNPTRLNVTGISTFTTGPVLIGSGTSTGTASQPLQVTGSAYVSGRLGIGQTNPVSGSYLDVNAGSISAPTYKGYFRIGPNSASSLSSNGGVEFLVSTYSNGYGWRAHSPDLGGGSTPFIVESRTDSSTWTERIRVDQSGRVTMPYQPGFFATSTSNNTNQPGSDPTDDLGPRFNNVAHSGGFNTGNHYNTTTGVFTAPVTGKYYTFFNMRWETLDFVQNNYIRIYISRNNSNAFYIHQINGTNEAWNSYMAMSCSGVISLAAGDTLRPKGGLNGGTAVAYWSESSWGAWLLG